MEKLREAFRQPGVRSAGLRLLLLYSASIGLFYLVDAGNRSAAEPMKPGVRDGKLLNLAVVFLVAAASNALAVLTFLFLCRKTGVAPRLAMVGFPLLLLLEQHARLGRADRESRRLEALLAAGLTTGVVGAGLALLRGLPFS